MQKLNRSLLENNSEPPIKVMQFGGGNFLKAFVDWMIQILNEEANFNAGVTIVKPTERGNYEEFRDQEGLFTVVLDGIVNEKLVQKKKLISCVQQIINPYLEWEVYMSLAENETIRFIVSNTTEAGIVFNKNDKKDDVPPKEFPAKLTLWLHHRFQYFNGDATKGCIFLPCELIENNGSVLLKTILQYADLWNLEKGFKDWIQLYNYFCNTLVDRIVSGYPKDRASKIQEELGYKDDLLVAGEYYHSWIIEAPKEIQKELPFYQTDLSVQFVEDLKPYREMKVKILNGAHTAMVPVGYLTGLNLVSDVMENKALCFYIEALLLNEVCTTLAFSDKVKKVFVLDVLNRFRNKTIKHQLLSISLNSTSKFVTRLLPTLKEYIVIEHNLPKRIVFALSALICFYKGVYQKKEISVKDIPEVVTFFSMTWGKYDSKEFTLIEMITSILSNEKIWQENLNEIPGLSNTVANYTQSIMDNGITKTLEVIH